MKLVYALLLVMTFSIPSQAQLKGLFDKAKKEILKTDDSDIGLGLKEALNNGVEEAVDKLSAKDGYLKSIYRIEIPKDAKKVTSKLKKVPGFQNIESDLIQKMNEAAELAAKEATPIFLDAIKGLSFKDASAILFGEKDEATRYLEGKTRDNLYETFLPIIRKSLETVNATAFWADAVNAYNKIPFVKKQNPDLDDHVNNKALDGMFSLIEVKEEGIRGDVSQRTSPLLQDVFGQLDN